MIGGREARPYAGLDAASRRTKNTCYFKKPIDNLKIILYNYLIRKRGVLHGKN